MSRRESDPVAFEGTEPTARSCLRVTAWALDYLATMLAEAARPEDEEPVPEQEQVYQRIAACASGQLSIISEHLFIAAGEPPEADRHLWEADSWQPGERGDGGGAPS